MSMPFMLEYLTMPDVLLATGPRAHVFTHVFGKQAGKIETYDYGGYFSRIATHRFSQPFSFGSGRIRWLTSL